MCTWCQKDWGLKAQVSGHKIAMVCRKCGGNKQFYTYKEVNAMIYKYETTIKELEDELKRSNK